LIITNIIDIIDIAIYWLTAFIEAEAEAATASRHAGRHATAASIGNTEQ